MQSYSRTAAWRPRGLAGVGEAVQALLSSWCPGMSSPTRACRSPDPVVSSRQPTARGVGGGTYSRHAYPRIHPIQPHRKSGAFSVAHGTSVGAERASATERVACCARCEPSPRLDLGHVPLPCTHEHTCIFGCSRGCPCPHSPVTTRGRGRRGAGAVQAQCMAHLGMNGMNGTRRRSARPETHPLPCTCPKGGEAVKRARGPRGSVPHCIKCATAAHAAHAAHAAQPQRRS